MMHRIFILYLKNGVGVEVVQVYLSKCTVLVLPKHLFTYSWHRNKKDLLLFQF